MKTAISVPDGTFRRVDARAAELGMSRSEFFSRAAELYLSELESQSLATAMNSALARSAEQQSIGGLHRLAALTEADEW